MLDLAYLERYRVLSNWRWELPLGLVYLGLSRLTRTRLVLHGFEPPRAPVLYATNSTQKYDFLAFRAAVRTKNVPLVTVTKAKNYHSRAMEPVLAQTGVIPLVSRGYILVFDAVKTAGRRPEAHEYRALRDHMEKGEPLPAGPYFDALARTERSILGTAYDPRAMALRDALNESYRALMRETVRLAREAVAAGNSVHVYPEGTVSPRLGQGRIGAMMFAQALGLPVVPVGMSGCAEAYAGNSPAPGGGTVHLRFGEAFQPDFSALPRDFRAFDPEHEARYKPALEAQTERLMSAIDALLDPAYRRDPARARTRVDDTRRFL